MCIVLIRKQCFSTTGKTETLEVAVPTESHRLEQLRTARGMRPNHFKMWEFGRLMGTFLVIVVHICVMVASTSVSALQVTFELLDLQYNEVIFVGEENLVLRCSFDGEPETTAAIQIVSPSGEVVIEATSEPCLDYTLSTVTEVDGSSAYTCKVFQSSDGVQATQEKTLILNVHSESPVCFRNGTTGKSYQDGDWLLMSCYCDLRNDVNCWWISTIVGSKLSVELDDYKALTYKTKSIHQTIQYFNTTLVDASTRYDCVQQQTYQSIGPQDVSTGDTVIIPRGTSGTSLQWGTCPLQAATTTDPSKMTTIFRSTGMTTLMTTLEITSIYETSEPSTTEGSEGKESTMKETSVITTPSETTDTFRSTAVTTKVTTLTTSEPTDQYHSMLKTETGKTTVLVPTEKTTINATEASITSRRSSGKTTQKSSTAQTSTTGERSSVESSRKATFPQPDERTTPTLSAGTLASQDLNLFMVIVISFGILGTLVVVSLLMILLCRHTTFYWDCNETGGVATSGRPEYNNGAFVPDENCTLANGISVKFTPTIKVDNNRPHRTPEYKPVTAKPVLDPAIEKIYTASPVRKVYHQDSVDELPLEYFAYGHIGDTEGGMEQRRPEIAVEEEPRNTTGGGEENETPNTSDNTSDSRTVVAEKEDFKKLYDVFKKPTYILSAWGGEEDGSNEMQARVVQSTEYEFK